MIPILQKKNTPVSIQNNGEKYYTLFSFSENHNQTVPYKGNATFNKSGGNLHATFGFVNLNGGAGKVPAGTPCNTLGHQGEGEKNSPKQKLCFGNFWGSKIRHKNFPQAEAEAPLGGQLGFPAAKFGLAVVHLPPPFSKSLVAVDVG